MARLMISEIENSSCVLFENDARIEISGKRIRAASKSHHGSVFFTVLVSIWRLLVVQWEKVLLHPRLSISHLEGPNFANLITGFGGPRVIFVHNTLAKSYPTTGRRDVLMRILCRSLYRRASIIVAVSPEIKSELKEFLAPNSPNILTLPNPIDCRRIEANAAEHYGDYRDVLCGKRFLVSVASLTTQKNHCQMLDVFAGLLAKPDEGQALKLMLLGDGPLREKLHDQCRRLNLAFFDAGSSQCFDDDAQVYFLGFQSNPYRLLSKARLMMLTSHWEGLPIALLEAMALGVPSVVSDCSQGIREVWNLTGKSTDSSTLSQAITTPFGLLVPSNEDSESAQEIWEEAIQQALSLGERREQMIENCQTRAQDYSIDRVTSIWNTELLSLAES
ncbi:MAG: glycosyltransferase [Bacteroidetes Order II. Incertae sedis bacterium]|nr:glycosyltransferase [Bacteroidetes Order II. bacterium]